MSKLNLLGTNWRGLANDAIKSNKTILPLWQGSLHRSTWHLAACESIELFELCCGCPRDVQILLKWPGSEWNQTTLQVPFWDPVGGCPLLAHFPGFPGIEEYQLRLQNTHIIKYTVNNSPSHKQSISRTMAWGFTFVPGIPKQAIFWHPWVSSLFFTFG